MKKLLTQKGYLGILLIIAGLLIVAVTGGTYLFLKQDTSQQPQPKTTSTPAPLPTIHLVQETESTVTSTSTTTTPNFSASPHVYILEDPSIVDTPEGFQYQELAKLFYSKYPDKYDFMAVFPTFQLRTEASLRGQGFHYTVQNNVKGICRPLIEQNPSYWGSSRLKGIDLYTYSGNDYQEWIENLAKKMNVLLEEVSHQWLVSIGQQPLTYGINESCYGTTLPLLDGTKMHWSIGLSTPPGHIGAMKEAMPWVDNGDGTYSFDGSLFDKPSKFHPFDLYLMGLADKSEIRGEFLLLSNIEYLPFDYKSESRITTARANVQKITIDDIVRIAGEGRTPSVGNSQKDFTIAFIILAKGGQTTPDVMYKAVNAAANAFPDAWAYATEYRSTMNKQN